MKMPTVKFPTMKLLPVNVLSASPRGALSLRPVLLSLALLLPSFLSGQASAQALQTQSIPQSRAEISLTFAPLVKRAAPAVVNVYGTKHDKNTRRTMFDDPILNELFGGGAQREREQQAVGSGVIVASDGYVVTNHHVIEGMSEVKVSLADKRELDAEIILRDPRTDLAVLKLKSTEKFPALELANSDTFEVGDLVLAIGNPFGVGQTVTQGIVSALARTQVGVSDYQFFIQTDAAINPGNSGGALIDMRGQLMGINTAIFSKSGGSHGIGFAIPTNMVKIVVDSARAGGGRVKRPWFGARLQSVSADMVESLGLQRPVGALVSSIQPNSPAEAAGMKAGDVIVAVDQNQIDDAEAFGFRLGTKAIGGTSNIAIIRGGKAQVLPIKLQSAPETPLRDAYKAKGKNPLSGITFFNLSPAVVEELSLNHNDSGAVIADIEQNSAAESLGFQKGDILVSINSAPVKTTKDIENLTKDRKYLWRISINRGGQIFTSAFGG